MASDHSQEDCALHPRREVPVVQLQEQRPAGGRRDELQGDARRRRGRRGACYAFNDGRCSLPYCRFEMCAQCAEASTGSPDAVPVVWSSRGPRTGVCSTQPIEKCWGEPIEDSNETVGVSVCSQCDRTDS